MEDQQNRETERKPKKTNGGSNGDYTAENIKALEGLEAVRLRPAGVERASVRCLVRDGAIKDSSVGFALVEAEMDEGADPAPALGRTEDQRLLDAAR